MTSYTDFAMFSLLNIASVEEWPDRLRAVQTSNKLAIIVSLLCAVVPLLLLLIASRKRASWHTTSFTDRFGAFLDGMKK